MAEAQRREMIGEIVSYSERGGMIMSVLVAHPKWAEPFELVMANRGKPFAGARVLGRRVRFSCSYTPEAPEAPKFVAFESD
jgi:hypothetical protein